MAPARAASTEHVPLCRPAGWAALWRRMSMRACLNG